MAKKLTKKHKKSSKKAARIPFLWANLSVRKPRIVPAIRIEYCKCKYIILHLYNMWIIYLNICLSIVYKIFKSK